LTRVGIHSGQVTPLVQIAFGTGESEIVDVISSSMFSRNEMLNLEWDERGGRLESLAVFAAIRCP